MIAAYLVTTEAGLPDISQMRTSLVESLPAYMVPQHFFAVPQMPLTPNAKLDRRALSGHPDAVQLRSTAVTTAPSTATEKTLVDIWQDVLGVEPVGVDSDFYELGGHSLLLTRIWTRARRSFGISLPLQSVFEARTVKMLAERVDAAASGDVGGIPHVSRLGKPKMSVAQERFWYISELAANPALMHMSMAFESVGPLDVGLLNEALNLVVSRHEILRTTLTWEGEVPRQVIAPALNFTLPVEDFTGRSDEDVMAAMQELTRQPFDLQQAPLVHACLYRCDDNRHVLYFTPHHAIWDGWSFDILLAEMQQHYESLLASSASPLPNLPIQYVDYAEWHRDRVASEEVTGQMTYWQEVLGEGALPVLDLAPGAERPERFSHDGDMVAIGGGAFSHD